MGGWGGEWGYGVVGGKGDGDTRVVGGGRGGGELLGRDVGEGYWVMDMGWGLSDTRGGAVLFLYPPAFKGISCISVRVNYGFVRSLGVALMGSLVVCFTYTSVSSCLMGFFYLMGGKIR